MEKISYQLILPKQNIDKFGNTHFHIQCDKPCIIVGYTNIQKVIFPEDGINTLANYGLCGSYFLYNQEWQILAVKQDAKQAWNVDVAWTERIEPNNNTIVAMNANDPEMTRIIVATFD